MTVQLRIKDLASLRNDKYLYMGGPLLAGVTVVALSSLAPMALPLGIRGLQVAEAVSLYGGLAVFSGFVLYEYAVSSLLGDTSKTDSMS